MQDEAFFLLRIDHFEAKPWRSNFAGITDLAARFAIERRLIEHDRYRLFVADFFQHLAQVILGDDAHHLCGRFHRFVAQKLGRFHSLGQTVDRAMSEDIGHFAAADAMPCSSICMAKTGPIELQISLGANLLQQFRRKSVGGVEVGGFYA